MKLAPEKLLVTLEKQLAGFYFCSGHDTFLVNELTDKIIASAKKKGFTEITRLYVDTHFPWEKVYESIHSPSLFSPKIALILQLSSWKLDDKTKKLFTEATESPSNDLLVIVKGPKIERAMSSAKWFLAMTENANWIDLPTLYPSQVPEWLMQRAAQLGIKLSRDHAQQLTRRTENNLPAAAQALEKLQILNLPITTHVIEDIVETSAEYDIFKLIDTCLAGDAVRTYHVFYNLKSAHAEPLMMIGAFARELRLLREILYAHSRNVPLKAAAQRVGVWDSRLPLIQTFMRTYQYADCQSMLAKLAELDAIAKGATPGQIWNELLVFCMKLGNKGK